MKKLIGLFSLLILLSLCNSPEAAAQIVVKVRPARPTVVLARPAKARRGHTWVAGHWNYSNRKGRYVWRKGHWQRNRKGQNYVAGKWVTSNGGHKWVAGRWTAIGVAVNNNTGNKKVVVVKKKRRPRNKRRNRR